MQRPVLADKLGRSICDLNIYCAVIDRQNTGAGCNTEHHDADDHKGDRQRLWAFHSAQAQHHHQHKERQKNAAKIRKPVGVQRGSKALGYRQHKVAEITYGYRDKYKQQPYITLLVRGYADAYHTQRYECYDSIG